MRISHRRVHARDACRNIPTADTRLTEPRANAPLLICSSSRLSSLAPACFYEFITTSARLSYIGMTIVQFAPFQSLVQPAFWHALTELKIDVTHLPSDCPAKAQTGDKIKVHYVSSSYLCEMNSLSHLM